MKTMRSSAKNDFFLLTAHKYSTQPPSWMDLFCIQSRLTTQVNCKAAILSRSPSKKPLQAHCYSRKSLSPHGHWPGAEGTQAPGQTLSCTDHGSQGISDTYISRAGAKESTMKEFAPHLQNETRFALKQLD